MNNRRGISVDLDRCVGCHSCEIACRNEHGLQQGNSWISVQEVGPEIVDGQLRGDHSVSILPGCDLCQKRYEEEREPACVVHCPTRAIRVLSTKEVLREQAKNRKQISLTERGQAKSEKDNSS